MATMLILYDSKILNTLGRNMGPLMITGVNELDRK